MKNFANILALYTLFIVCAVNPTLANFKLTKISDFEVASQPVSLFFDKESNKLNIFCNGIDRNFNGLIDDGDEAATWWQLEKSKDFNATQKVEFERFLHFPFRPAYLASTETKNGRVFIPFGNIMDETFTVKESGYVSSYDLTNTELLNQFVTNFFVESVSYAGSEHFLLTRNAKFGENGKVEVYDVPTKQSLQSLDAGLSVIDARVAYTSTSKMKVIFLNFGINNSTIQIGEVSHMKEFTTKTLNAGKGSNYIDIHGDLLAVVASDSSKVMFYDIEKEEFLYEIAVPFEGQYNGPRECKFINKDYLAVSSYSNKFYILDLTTKTIILTEELPYKSENIAVFDDMLAVTMPLDASFTPVKTVRLYNFEIGGTSVKTNSDSNFEIKSLLWNNNESYSELLKSANINLEFTLFNLYSTAGVRIFETENLPKGTYFLISNSTNQPNQVYKILKY